MSVHRDLESLVAAWLGRSAPDQTIGVVHIGFDRPSSSEFDEMTPGYEGRVLVTTSARYGLPPTFGASEGEVGRVGNLAVFLGTRGWGYQVDEGELPPVRQQAGVGTNRRATGWVSSFLGEHPDALDELQKNAIFDDVDYLEREKGLPLDLRHRAGTYRLQKTIVGEHGDPCAFARAAPPWFLEREFNSISVGVRIETVFETFGIKTVSNLAEHSLGELLRTQNFGRKSAADLFRILALAITEGPQPEDRLERAAQSTLIESIKASLLKHNDRARDIMLRRMGLGQPSETLQEVGERYSITRERVRQVEAKAVARLIREEVWDDMLTVRVAKLLENRRIPLPLKGIEAADAWFSGIGEEAYAIRYLLNNMSKGPAKVVRIDEIDYVGMLHQDKWEGALIEAKQFLESGADSAWTEEHCRTVVESMLPESCSEFRDLLWDHASHYGQFVERNGERNLVSYGRSSESIVQAVLASSDQPLHFKEIARLASERAGREIDDRRAHAAAASIGLLMGRGIYGLDRHVPIAAERMTAIADEATEVVSEGMPGRQWHSAEILGELADRGFEHEAGLDKYVLDIALKRFGNLERLGRLVWCDLGSTSVDSYRIDIRQAVIAALQEAGGPLTASEIRHAVTTVRGVNGPFQIHPIDPVMRIAPSLWGLNDRDIPIKREGQKRILDTLVEVLNKRGSGIHQSEISESKVLSSVGMSVTAFFSLATTDRRIRTSSGRFLYLEEWGGPRRETISEAVRYVLRAANTPLKFEQIHERVAARVGRAFSPSAVSACLQALEASLDTRIGMWVLQEKDGAQAHEETDVPDD